MEHTIVAIGRQFGSGGRLIGKQVAEKLGIAFYDRELITLTAKQCGYDEAVVAEAENTRTKSFLYSLYMTTQELPVSDQIYIAQFRVVREVAEKEPCVIVGRCADYALRDHPRCAKVFIHAPLEERVRRVAEEYGVKEKNLEAYVRKEDKRRASYYTHFTQQKWGAADNYHLSVDSSVGLNKSAELIINLVKGTFDGK